MYPFHWIFRYLFRKKSDLIMASIEPTKVSFFWDPSQDMTSSGFTPKKHTFNWETRYVSQSEPYCFFGGKPLELMSWIWSQKKLTLVGLIVWQDLFWVPSIMLGVSYFFQQIYIKTELNRLSWHFCNLYVTNFMSRLLLSFKLIDLM